MQTTALFLFFSTVAVLVIPCLDAGAEDLIATARGKIREIRSNPALPLYVIVSAVLVTLVLCSGWLASSLSCHC